MKFSYNWLSELVPGLEADAKAVGAEITMKTAECDGVDAHENDFVIEIDNKSLTHRPDLWGHYGMAREVASHFRKSLQNPVDLSVLPQGEPGVKIEIENFDLCPRFSAVLFENVKIGPSPLWLQKRLEAVGINPINNVVDITNYAMMLLPQPMHAFDADRVTQHTLIARAARQGETCTALNDESYDLDPSMIVVAGVDGPLAIAGVMGGASSMIHEGTSRIILEAATWHPSSIRKTSVKLSLRTDASARFEKALDPENTVMGIALAIQLMQECCPEAKLVGGLADVYRPLISPDDIELEIDWLRKKLGRDIEQSEVVSILTSIGFDVEEESGRLKVAVPSWRATKDISVKDDLVEEVGRMIGYASITPQPPLMAVNPPVMNLVRKFHNGIRRTLVDVGYTEVQNYSFVSDEDARRFGSDPVTHVRVLNPIAEDQALLRTSLIPKIHHNIEENRKHFESFRLFEIGNEIHKKSAGLPDEIAHLAVALYAKDDGVAGLNELKRVGDSLFPGLEFRSASDMRIYEHPVRTADVWWRGEKTGRLFEFHPDFVEHGRAAVLNLDLAKLQELSSAQTAVKYTPVNRFPSSSFDLAVIVPARAFVSDASSAVAELGHIPELIEDYRMQDGRRSLLFRMTLSREDRTLTGEEVTSERTRLIEGLRSKGYELRA